jgi:Na+/melibiose symporter-like transporter
MIAEYLRSLDGIEAFGVTGLLLSVILFVAMVIWTFRTDREYIRTMEQLPLDMSDATVKHPEKAHP